MNDKPKRKIKATGMRTMGDLWSRWYGKAMISTAGFLAVVLVLAMIGDSAVKEKEAEAKPTNAPTAATDLVDRPTEAERVALRRALNKVDSRMAGYATRYEGRAVNTCQMLQDNDWPESRYVSMTVERFSGGTLEDFSAAQAKQVLSAVRSTFCDGTWKVVSEGKPLCSDAGCALDLRITSSKRDDKVEAAVDTIDKAFKEGIKPGPIAVSVAGVVVSCDKGDVATAQRSVADAEAACTIQ